MSDHDRLDSLSLRPKAVAHRGVTAYTGGQACQQQDPPGHEERILAERKRVFSEMPEAEFREWVKSRKAGRARPSPCVAGCGRPRRQHLGLCGTCYHREYQRRRRELQAGRSS